MAVGFRGRGEWDWGSKKSERAETDNWEEARRRRRTVGKTESWGGELKRRELNRGEKKGRELQRKQKRENQKRKKKELEQENLELKKKQRRSSPVLSRYDYSMLHISLLHIVLSYLLLILGSFRCLIVDIRCCACLWNLRLFFLMYFMSGIGPISLALFWFPCEMPNHAFISIKNVFGFTHLFKPVD